MTWPNQKLPDKTYLLFLRHDKGMTLQEIADKYGSSRERIRQVIGNTGRDFISKFVEKNAVITSDMTSQTAFLKYPRAKKVIQKMLSSIHHAVDGKSSTAMGNGVERLVDKKLTSLGIGHRLMALHHPFDILLENGTRIDVKSSKSKAVTGPNQKHDMYGFGVKKDKRGDYCDFFICYIVPTKTFFVIPNDRVGYVNQFYIAWPTPERSWSGLEQYLNRFDLLKG